MSREAKFQKEHVQPPSLRETLEVKGARKNGEREGSPSRSFGTHFLQAPAT